MDGVNHEEQEAQKEKSMRLRESSCDKREMLRKSENGRKIKLKKRKYEKSMRLKVSENERRDKSRENQDAEMIMCDYLSHYKST